MDWCWSWNSSTLATSCEELTHWKRPWCWEGLGAGGEGDARGWDGWMASPTLWTWVLVDSGSWWWTRRPGVLRFMGSWRVRHDWVTELKWNALKHILKHLLSLFLFISTIELLQIFFSSLSIPITNSLNTKKDTFSYSSFLQLSMYLDLNLYCLIPFLLFLISTLESHPKHGTKPKSS